MPLYEIAYTSEAIRFDIPALSRAMRTRVQHAIDTKLRTNPIAFGKPLQYQLAGARSLRVGNWRIIYCVVPEPPTVRIITIDHRRDVYGH